MIRMSSKLQLDEKLLINNFQTKFSLIFFIVYISGETVTAWWSFQVTQAYWSYFIYVIGWLHVYLMIQTKLSNSSCITVCTAITTMLLQVF